MAEDFITGLGETITKTAKDITSKADNFFEIQKGRTKIISEQRMIDKILEDIGNVIYKKYVDGAGVDEEIISLCEDVTQRKVAIAKYREEMAKVKGNKVCPSCGSDVPLDAAFCMHCGTPCQKEEEPVKDADFQEADEKLEEEFQEADDVLEEEVAQGTEQE